MIPHRPVATRLVPDVANLDARVGDNIAEWRAKKAEWRRRQAEQMMNVAAPDEYGTEHPPRIWKTRSVDVLLQVFVWGFACGCGLIGGLWWMAGR